MEASGVIVEEAAVSPVKLVDPVGAVLGGVRVHDVQEHDQPQAMRRVDQLLQLLRRPVPTTQYKQEMTSSFEWTFLSRNRPPPQALSPEKVVLYRGGGGGSMQNEFLFPNHELGVFFNQQVSFKKSYC